MTATNPAISVIIRTLAEGHRRDAIYRALTSITTQEGVKAIPIVVANGDRFDASLLAELEVRRDLRYCYLEEGSLTGSRRIGRTMVDTPFFCFLDDDDEYLPGGLRNRSELLLARDDADVVVGSGYRIVENVRSLSGWKGGEPSLRDPLRELLADNWLAPSAALFRSSRVDVEFFEDAPGNFEWTYLAFKLCVTKRVIFSDLPGHVMHDTPGSASKSDAYKLAQASVLRDILRLNLPADVHHALREKYGLALHEIADHYRMLKQYGKAWRFHLKSLLQPKGIRYAPYTRRLLQF